MRRGIRTRIRRVLLCLGTALAAGAFLHACSNHPSGTRVDNLRPHIEVTGGPRDGDRGAYRSVIYWTGWDDDGRIEFYEYAIDPPEGFSRDEIEFPEAAATVTTRLIRGPVGGADTVRVSKIVDGATISFDYVRTGETSRAFTLSTPDPDSAYAGSRLRATGTASGLHTLYVRALDNEGAYSEPGRLAFTAWSYAPRSYIAFPYIRDKAFLSVGGRLRISWYGIDPDPPATSPKPAGFLYKLVDLKALDPPLTIHTQQLDLERVFYELTPDVPWTYQDADTPGITIFVEPSEYVFAVRAVDEAGAVEPFLLTGRPNQPGNAFKFVSTETGGRPIITLQDATVGTFELRGARNHAEVEVAAGVPLKFRWSASAALYGGEVESFSYGVDIQDLDTEGPGSGWSPWGPILTTPTTITFKKQGYHLFYIRARDTSGNVQIGTLGLNIFEIPLERELLIVDDFRNTANPLDNRHDAFWNEIVVNSGRFEEKDLDPALLWYEVGGPGDRFYLTYNVEPTLRVLGRYRLVVWILNGDGWCGHTGFLKAAVMSPTVRSYIAVGGKLWLLGSLTLSATRRAEYDCNDPEQPFHDRRAPILPRGELDFPITFAPGDFAYDILHLATDAAQNDKAEYWENGMIGVSAWDPDDPVFPSMEVDGSKFVPAYWANNALNHSDAIFDPILVNGAYERPGVLDSLYAYRAAVEVRPTKRSFLLHSPYSDKLCATRWHDPDPDREQGRVMWFGFPLYHMFTDQAQETFNRAIDWFREEYNPPPTP